MDTGALHNPTEGRIVDERPSRPLVRVKDRAHGAEDRDVIRFPRPVQAVVPARAATASDLERLMRCLVTLRMSAPVAAVTVAVETDAPELLPQLEAIVAELESDLIAPSRPESRAAAVNTGLRSALEAERDAVIVAGDLEFRSEGWLDRIVARTDTAGRLAAVVGGRVLFPEGVIEHAGLQFSLLRREFIPRYRFAPAALPEALKACRCPVGGSLQLIRHETLVEVGLYDEDYASRWEDVDYCLRVFEAGLECIYEPSVAAICNRSLWEAQPTEEQQRDATLSSLRLSNKHGDTDLAQWIAEVRG